MTYVDPVDHTKLAKLREVREEYVPLLALPCENPAQLQWWKERLSYLQAHIMDHEAERQHLIRPILDDQQRINKLFKEEAAPADALKEQIKLKIAAYEEQALAARNELVAAASSAAASGDSEACALALGALQDVPGSFVWEVASVDTGKVDRQYLTVDTNKLKVVCLAYKKSETPPEIEGVIFKRTARVSARRGKGT